MAMEVGDPFGTCAWLQWMVLVVGFMFCSVENGDHGLTLG